MIVTFAAPTGPSVEVTEGQGIVLRESAAVAEQMLVQPPTVVDPAPGDIRIVDGSVVKEMVLGTEVTGVTVQATVILPNCSNTPWLRMKDVVEVIDAEHWA